MADKNILHMLTPLKHISPFDVNMALDAGYDAVTPYTSVSADEVTGLVQDAMFSRSPKTAVRTGIFIGGKNAVAALDMMEAAKKAQFPPFEMSVFADPAGSFTTAAAMVACVESTLKKNKDKALKGLKVAVFGATGVVGFSAGVIAALEGADVTLVGYDGLKRVAASAEEIKTRFKVEVHAADGSDDGKKREIMADAEAVLAAGRAGVQVLSKDVNAVPPPGIEGLEAKANGDALGPNGAVGIGALAIGNVKYKTEFGLFKTMVEATKVVRFDFRDAFTLAREIAQ
jgi:methylene-tetrahydromethanopterin dehydrogenase